MIFRDTQKLVRTATIGAAIYLLCFGLAMAVFPIRTFWNDEWRLLYNIKFKTFGQLWGTLDLLQQCPRTYLTVIKAITLFFDYSYSSIRFPALIIGASSILLCFFLSRKILPSHPVNKYLFILILISSGTFTDYLVQVKHYQMELFLCLLALWQLMSLLDLADGVALKKPGYLLLCFSLLAAPFFGYTYPIVVAPVFFAMLVRVLAGTNEKGARKAPSILTFWLPFSITLFSIFLFYLVDVKQLLADKSMYYSYLRMLGREKNDPNFLADFWHLFALVGAGDIYQVVFGVTGISAFVYGIVRLARSRFRLLSREDYFRIYAILLIFLTLGLFVTGKMLGGVARLTAYTIPSIALLIVFLLGDMPFLLKLPRLSAAASVVLFGGLLGNIVSTCINTFTYPEYSSRIRIYWNCSEALKQARLHRLPMLYTEMVRGDNIPPEPGKPGKVSAHTITPEQVAGVDVLCAEVVLKVNPEYKVWDSIPLYLAPDARWTSQYLDQLPPYFTSVIANNGLDFMQMERSAPEHPVSKTAMSRLGNTRNLSK